MKPKDTVILGEEAPASVGVQTSSIDSLPAVKTNGGGKFFE